jgi:protein-S-isoprenylcysteine O-methyltransferase Ste14
MWNVLVLAAGGVFLTVMILTGLLLRLEGRDVRGKAPISRPLFLAGKAATGLLWGMALWRAADGMGKQGGHSPFWLEEMGAVLFAAGCCLAVAAFFHLGREVRFGLPGGECRLKTRGLYAWSRHPMYMGFHLMALGSCLFVFNALGMACLFLALWTHHRVALEEERFMETRFGREWREYAGRVPRYGLIPLRRIRP